MQQSLTFVWCLFFFLLILHTTQSADLLSLVDTGEECTVHHYRPEPLWVFSCVIILYLYVGIGTSGDSTSSFGIGAVPPGAQVRQPQS